MALCITRRREEGITITIRGVKVKLKVIKILNNAKVQLRIEGPKEAHILRNELVVDEQQTKEDSK